MVLGPSTVQSSASAQLAEITEMNYKLTVISLCQEQTLIPLAHFICWVAEDVGHREAH